MTAVTMTFPILGSAAHNGDSPTARPLGRHIRRRHTVTQDSRLLDLPLDIVHEIID